MILFVVALFFAGASAQYGTLLGGLGSGSVYIVNKTTVQITGYRNTDSGKQFWFDAPAGRGKVQEIYVHEGKYLKQKSNDANNPSGATLVINTPFDQDIKSFKKFGVASASGSYEDSVSISSTASVPSVLTLSEGLSTKHYGVKSKNVKILDEKTLLLEGFSFDGTKPPDGYIFVGEGRNVKREFGEKAFVRGQDTGRSTPKTLKREFTNEDIIVDLPGDKTVKDIDFVAVYCYAVGVDFGHTFLDKSAIRQHNIPPHVPPVVGGSFAVASPWKISQISGERAFDVKLGPNGGDAKGYSALRGASPKKWVFYVNGDLAPELIVKADQTLIFKVYGGNSWRLYITNEETGGFNLKPSNELPLVKVYAKQETKAGQLCWYGQEDTNRAPSSFSTFPSFKQALYSKCDPEGANQPYLLTWTPPSRGTYYYGSLNHYNMGWKITVV